MHVVGEDLLAVDLDHGNQLAVATLELGVAVDRHLFELEPQLRVQSAHALERPLAEVTAVSVVDGHTDGLRYVIQGSVGGGAQG